MTKSHKILMQHLPRVVGVKSKVSNYSPYEHLKVVKYFALNYASVNVDEHLSRKLKSAIGVNMYDTLLIMLSTLMVKIAYNFALINV